MVKDIIYTRSINSLLPTLLYILAFTIVVELIGAAAVFFSIHGVLDQTTHEDIVFSLFHSMNAFCNSGFSNIDGGLSNPALMNSNQMFYIILSIIIFSGGIGFPVLVNIKDAFFFSIKRLCSRISKRKPPHRMSHLYNINTKVAIYTTITVLFCSIILFIVFEYENTLAGMSPWEKFAQAFFNSVSPRSAGFSSINPTGYMNLTIVLMIILMWIGGASQSTAGGIKVNTLATMFLSLKAIISGQKHVTVFSRTISDGSIRRAYAIIAISIISLASYSMVLLALEPALSAKGLIFEAASALFNVGITLDITPLLGTSSKFLLCSAMFLGRVGLLSLMTGLFAREKKSEFSYPTDNIIIN